MGGGQEERHAPGLAQLPGGLGHGLSRGGQGAGGGDSV